MKVIFLDRDGVINRDPGFGGYITCWDEFEFLPGALEALKKLSQAGFEVIVISNQAGVAKRLYTEEDLDELTRNMLKEVEKAGGRIHSVHYCPHKDEDNCACRKPQTGLFSQATKDLEVDFSDSFFVGDNRRDVLAAAAIGCRSIFVLSGNTKLEDLDIKPDFIAEDLLGAVDKIILSQIRKVRILSRFKEKIKRIIFHGKRLKEIDRLEGHFGLNEGHLVCKIANSLKDNSVIVEIGAFKGKSTCFIAEGIGSKNCEFYTIDIWFNDGMQEDRQDVFADFLKNIGPYKDKIKPLRGYSYEVRKNWPNSRKIDFLWIDGDHSCKGVKRDIQDWIPLVKKNGIICFHDYRDEPDVKKAVDEISENGTIRFIKTEGCIYMAKRN